MEPKFVRVTVVGGLLLLLAASPAFARPDHEDRDHGRGRHEQQAHFRGEGHGPSQNYGHGPGHGHAYGREMAPGQHRMPPGQVRKQLRHEEWELHRAHAWREEHRSWHARGGYYGYRVPPMQYRAHFGRAHCFRMHALPVMVVEGHPRFQYGGFWFTMVDPYPEYWAPTWYQTDDVYIDYVNDGYYMYNRSRPGVAIAVNISF